jgi:hypothetical protein
MEALSRDPDIVAISHEATYIREHLPFGLTNYPNGGTIDVGDL